MTQQKAQSAPLRAKLARSGKGLGPAPTSKIFCVWPQGKTLKIRKCIDTCIACQLANTRFCATFICLGIATWGKSTSSICATLKIAPALLKQTLDMFVHQVYTVYA